MKLKRELLVLVFGILLVIFSAWIVSADGCSIVQRSACTNTNEIILGLSDLTNAHAQTWDDPNPYQYTVCCDFTSANPHTCSGTNKVVGLSAQTNAHAQEPARTTYPIDICFADLECVASSNSCDISNGYIELFSLSSPDNAHVGAFADYPTKICCKQTFVPPTETLSWVDANDANTQVTTVQAPTEVNMKFEIDLSVGEVINYRIYERDFLIDDLIKTGSYTVLQTDVDRGFALVTWTTLWENDNPLVIPSNDPEYVFTTNNFDGSATLESGELIVTEAPEIPGPVITCDTSGAFPQWFADGIFESDASINCERPDYIGSCCLNGYDCVADECVLSVPDTLCSKYGDPTTCNSVDETSPEYSVALETVSFFREDERNCESDWFIAREDDPSYEGILIKLVNCRCEWEVAEEKCEGVYGYETDIDDTPTGISPNVGECTFDKRSDDNCADGFLKYDWTARWDWHVSNSYTASDIPVGQEDDFICNTDGSVCHYDPNQESQSCINGSRTIPCKGALELGFFSWFNFLVSSIILIIIYTSLIVKRRLLLR
ncbi:hypothetical protein J4225_03990 [Candidatus Pacearchaeota archaeon]|nr:hypothetical protein [Candidatus Pacearchaeota archaeon]